MQRAIPRFSASSVAIAAASLVFAVTCAIFFFQYEPAFAEDHALKPLHAVSLEATEGKLAEQRPLLAKARMFLSRTFEKLFAIRSVEVNGTYRIPAAEMEKLVEDAKGLRFWSFSSRGLSEKLRRHPWIEEARVSLDYWPWQVRVELKEAEPWVVAELRGHSWLVSRSGKLLQTLDTIKSPDGIIEASELPRVSGFESAPQDVEWRLKEALRLLRLLDLAGGVPFDVEQFVFTSGGSIALRAVDERTPEVLVSAETYSEAVEQLRRLSIVLHDLQRRNQTTRSIDLRFKNRAILS